MTISGGDPDYQQLVKYNILNDRFIDYGDDYLKRTPGNGDGEYGTSVYFTQINENILYTINQNGKSIHVYNLESLSYHVLDTTIPITVNHQGSIASSEAPIRRLYITGGYLSDILDDLQILELEVLQWVATPPSMNNARWHHGSIVVNDRLWVIGGIDEDSVEAINITNIVTAKWQNIGNLSCQLARPGITVVDKVIYIVGGACQDVRTDVVHTIDTETNSISICPYNLPVATSGMPAIAIGHTIYGFGGYSGGYHLSSWMTLDMLCIYLIRFRL